MKNWILNLVGVSLFGILIEILLPTGTVNKYIKGILSLVLVYVIVCPIISIFTNYQLGNFSGFINEDIVIDNDFVNEINIDSNKLEEKNLEKILDNVGYKNVKVNIVSNLIQQNKIEFVKISLKNLVIENENPNIDIKEKITAIISKRLKIDSNRIYYE